MAYIRIEVSGNPNFGGYLSVDEGSSIKLSDSDVYELDEGQHLFEIHSTSDFDRKAGGARRWLYNNTSSSGSILDSIERHDIAKQLGDDWNFQVVVDANDLIVISVMSKGEKIIGSPSYQIYDMDEETRTAYDEHFAQIHAEAERIANTPRRSWKMIFAGLGVLAWFSYILVNQISNVNITFDPSAGIDGIITYITELNVALDNSLIFFGICILIGLLLFVLGVRKKVRR